MNKSIAIGSDHAGFELKEVLVKFLRKEGYDVKDFGTHSIDRVDYPDFAHPLSKEIEAGNHELGVLICGSANGVSMAANKHGGIRCAICWNEEIASLARAHNNANVIALPARFISEESAIRCLSVFLRTEFEGGRHEERVKKIRC